MMYAVENARRKMMKPYFVKLGQAAGGEQIFPRGDGERAFSLKKCEQILVYDVTVIGLSA